MDETTSTTTLPTPKELNISKPMDKDGWDANASLIWREVIAKNPELLQAARTLAPVFEAYINVAGLKALGRLIRNAK